MVRFNDNSLGCEGEAEFLVALVTRPICDKGNIAIHSSRGAFLVDEKLAMPVVAQLKEHAKLYLCRNGPGSLYELNASLNPQGFQRQEA